MVCLSFTFLVFGLMFDCCSFFVLFDLAVRSGVADVSFFFFLSRSLKWLSTGASFVAATSCFKYMCYNTSFHFMIDVLNLKLCFATDVVTERSGSLSEPGSIFPFWSKPNGVPLFYWLEKACSAYPRLRGSTFLLNIMWKGQLLDSPWLALVWLFHKYSPMYSIFHYPQTWKIP